MSRRSLAWEGIRSEDPVDPHSTGARLLAARNQHGSSRIRMDARPRQGCSQRRQRAGHGQHQPGESTPPPPTSRAPTKGSHTNRRSDRALWQHVTSGVEPVGFPSPSPSQRAARPAIPVSPRSTDAMNRRSVSQAGPPPEKTITLASLIAPRLVRRVTHQTSYKSIASHRTTFFLSPGRVVGWERKKKSHRQRGSGRPASARAAAGEEGRRRAGSRVSELASLRGTPILILGVAHLREAFPSRESTILEAPDPCQRSGSGLFGSPRRVFDEFLSVFGEPNL